MAFFSHASKSSAVFLPQFPKSMGMIGQPFAQLPPALEDRLQRGDGQRLPETAGTGKEAHGAFLTDKGMQVRGLVHVHVAPSPEILVRAVRRSSCLLMAQGYYSPGRVAKEWQERFITEPTEIPMANVYFLTVAFQHNLVQIQWLLEELL